MRAEDVALLAVHGDYVFGDGVDGGSQRVALCDGAEAHWSPHAHRAQRDEEDELPADQEEEYAQRERGDLDAGWVSADADGDDDGDDDEAEGEVPVKVVERPRAGAAQGPARGGFLGEPDGAEDEGVQAHDAEDGGEDGEDVGRLEAGGVAEGEVAGQGQDAAREEDDGGLEGDDGGVLAQVQGDAGDWVFWCQGCVGGLAAVVVVVGFGFGG